MCKIKKCSKCGEVLPMTSEYFGKNKNTKDGVMQRCRSCRSGAEKQYYIDNKERIRAYYETNKEAENLKSKRYYRENKAAVMETKKLYRLKNKEAIAQREKLYKLEHKESGAEDRKNYYCKSKDRIRETVKIYRKNNPELHRISNQKRRAKKRKLTHTLTATQWVELRAIFNFKCAYCGNESPITQDHFLAISNGGEYTKDNIIPSCLSCNSSKGKKNFFEWYPKQLFYSKPRELKVLNALGYKNLTQQLTVF